MSVPQWLTLWRTQGYVQSSNISNGGRPLYRCKWPDGPHMRCTQGQIGCQELVGLYDGRIRTWDGR